MLWLTTQDEELVLLDTEETRFQFRNIIYKYTVILTVANG